MMENIVFLCAHPDDFTACCGTALRMRKRFSLHLWDFTKGERGLIEQGVSMEECLYLGDTNTDMKTGINAGAVTVGVTWGFRDREELEAFSPAYIADHPGDVVQIVKDVNGIEEDGK